MPASAGYSGTPLVRKLGLKPGMRVRLLDPPDGYWGLLGGDPDALDVELDAADASGPGADPGADPDAPSADALPGAALVDFTHLFATAGETLEAHFRAARAGMAEDGMVWASWPKKSSGVESEIGRSEVMAAGKAAGLVDVKVCAVDETWSGLKFVIPVAERGK